MSFYFLETCIIYISSLKIEAKLSVDDNNEPTLKRKAEPAQTDISPESKHNKVDKEGIKSLHALISLSLPPIYLLINAFLETEDTQKPITSSSETDQVCKFQFPSSLLPSFPLFTSLLLFFCLVTFLLGATKTPILVQKKVTTNERSKQQSRPLPSDHPRS